MAQIRIDRELVCNPLTGLNELKLFGLRELHPRVLKELADVLAEPLSNYL